MNMTMYVVVVGEHASYVGDVWGGQWQFVFTVESYFEPFVVIMCFFTT